ncbi:Uncharacterised protein [Vibrio cholerae]|nr:Uncharacterised protein [Vibrio cholerae]
MVTMGKIHNGEMPRRLRISGVYDVCVVFS